MADLNERQKIFLRGWIEGNNELAYLISRLLKKKKTAKVTRAIELLLEKEDFTVALDNVDKLDDTSKLKQCLNELKDNVGEKGVKPVTIKFPERITQRKTTRTYKTKSQREKE